MGTDIYLKCKEQSKLENALVKKRLTCNWKRCHPNDQYFVLKILTGYLPSIPERGNITNLQTMDEMKKCVKYFLQYKEICPEKDLPKYDPMLYELGAIHKRGEVKYDLPDITIIACKLYDWLEIGIEFGASICVI